jgi:nucleotide-binding universal stress UspA family protein
MGSACSSENVNVPSTLIVPVDGSDFASRALPIAVSIGDRFGADVVALTTPMTLGPDHASAIPDWLATLVAKVASPRVSARVAADDDPARAVAGVVATSRQPAVCMATHARGPIGTAALGNVSQQVLRSVAVPVLLVGRHCDDAMSEHGPVVVCHDGSPAADAVLAPAKAWAHALGVPLVLVHVYHPLDVPTAQDPTAAIDPAIEFLGPDVRAEVVASSFPAGAIRDLAHEADASMIAISTHGRTGAARVVMGSVAEWVTREASCPVLTVRPDDLVG